MANQFYDLDEVRSISLLDVCEALGILVEKKGSSCFCKLRNERTASCKLYLDNPGEPHSFYDFGANVGGDVIKFVSCYENCDWQQALERLANLFNIAPINNNDYLHRNELTDSEYAKIGIYGDRASKNFDLNLDKFSIEAVQAYSEKYAMQVNQLRKDYPSKYEYDVLRKRAIPYVYKKRNDYYFQLYCALSTHKLFASEFDIKNISEDVLLECSTSCGALIKAEKLLKKALEGTNVKYTFKDYDVASDLKKIFYGEISFEIGENSYSEVKRASCSFGVDLMFKPLKLDEYLALGDFGITDVFHAAFLKDDKVNLAYLPDQSAEIDKCMRLYNQAKGIEVADGLEPGRGDEAIGEIDEPMLKDTENSVEERNDTQRRSEVPLEL